MAAAAAKTVFFSSPALLQQSFHSSQTRPHSSIKSCRPKSLANPGNGVFIRSRNFRTEPVIRERRNTVHVGSRLIDDGNSGDDDESAQRNLDTGAAIDIKLPRRSLLVAFTCNQCGERTKRLVNRLAYERGLVFVQDKILEELALYRRAKRLFGLRIAIRQRNKSSPVEWWSSFGASTPNLQKFAMKVLRLACSASSCEHDWSVFEECAGCLKYHKLVDNLGLIVEYDFREEDGMDVHSNSDQV